MEGKLLRKVRESFGRCTLKKGFYESFYENFFASSPEISVIYSRNDLGHMRQLVKNDISFLLLFAGDQQAGKIALKKLTGDEKKSTLKMRADIVPLWKESLIKTVHESDPRVTPEVEAGWREVLELGFNNIH